MLAVVLGVLLMSATVMFHIVGTIVWVYLGQHNKIKPMLARGPSSISVRGIIRAFFQTTVVIMILHIVEIMLWAFAYYFLPKGAGPESLNDCVYFSMVTYTTLGYGDIVVVDDKWRLLTGIQAMGGMLTFGWSSALLFAAVQQVMRLNKLSTEDLN